MKVKIHKRCNEDIAALVDWRLLEPLWIRSTFAPLDRSNLIDAYSDLWFDKSNYCNSFTLGEIGLEKNKQGMDIIMFTNGRHRTNLLIKHQPLIPVAFQDEIPTHPVIQPAIIKSLNEGDVVDIPDLPIYSITRMRETQRHKI